MKGEVKHRGPNGSAPSYTHHGSLHPSAHAQRAEERSIKLLVLPASQKRQRPSPQTLALDLARPGSLRIATPLAFRPTRWTRQIGRCGNLDLYIYVICALDLFGLGLLLLLGLLPQLVRVRARDQLRLKRKKGRGSVDGYD